LWGLLQTYTICCTMRINNSYRGGIHNKTGINMRIPSFDVSVGLQRVEGAIRLSKEYAGFGEAL